MTIQMAAHPAQELKKAGQSPWLDSISRKLLQSGLLKSYIEDDGLSGVTSNPSIFQKAISQGEGYEADIQKLVRQGKTTLEIYDTLTVQDIQNTCDLFKPVFKASDGEDGFVSLEVLPCLAHLEEATYDEAHRLPLVARLARLLLVRAVEREPGPAIVVELALGAVAEGLRPVARGTRAVLRRA